MTDATHPEDLVPKLSARQMAIAELIHGELSDLEISGALRMSPHTVRSHLRQIFGKLNVVCRVGVALAYERHSRNLLVHKCDYRPKRKSAKVKK